MLTQVLLGLGSYDGFIFCEKSQWNCEPYLDFNLQRWLSDLLIQISDMMYFFIMNKTNCCWRLNCHFFPFHCRTFISQSLWSLIFLISFNLFCIFPHYSISFQSMTYRECENFPALQCWLMKLQEMCRLLYHLSASSLWPAELQLFVLQFIFGVHWHILQSLIFPIWRRIDPGVKRMNQSPFSCSFVRAGICRGKQQPVDSKKHWSSLTPLDL